MRDREPGYAYDFLRIRAVGGSQYSIDFLHATHSGNSGHSFEAVWTGIALRSADAAIPRLYPVRVEATDGLLLDAFQSVDLSAPHEPDWNAGTVFWRSDDATFALYDDFLGERVFPDAK